MTGMKKLVSLTYGNEELVMSLTAKDEGIDQETLDMILNVSQVVLPIMVECASRHLDEIPEEFHELIKIMGQS